MFVLLSVTFWLEPTLRFSCSDRGNKPVHGPGIWRVSQVAPAVGNRTCRHAVVLGERAELHWRRPAVMVHCLCRAMGRSVDPACRSVTRAVTLSVGTLVGVVVRVAVRARVGEPGVCRGAGWHRSPAWLTLEPWRSQAAGGGPIRQPLRTEAAARLLHHLRALTRQHACWRWMSDDVIDAKHAGLAVCKSRRRWWGVVGGRGQLLAVRRVDRHVGVHGTGVRRWPGDLDRGEYWRLLDIRGVGAEVAALEPLPAPQKAATLKHVLRIGVQRPVVALPGSPGFPRDLDEAVVQRQVVADGVLPLLGVVSVEGEPLGDELVDPPQRQLAVGGVGDGHGDESDVAVRRFPPLQRSLPPPATRLLILCLRGRVGGRQAGVRRRLFLHFHHRHYHCKTPTSDSQEVLLKSKEPNYFWGRGNQTSAKKSLKKTNKKPTVSESKSSRSSPGRRVNFLC